MVFCLSGCRADYPAAPIGNQSDSITRESHPQNLSNEIAYQLDDSLRSPNEEQIKQILDQSQGILTLKQAVAWAEKHSHRYQKQQEDLYLQTRNATLTHFHLLSRFPKQTCYANWPTIPSMPKPTSDAKQAIEKAKTTTELAEAWAAVLTGPVDVDSASALRRKIGDPMPKHVQRDSRSGDIIQSERDLASLVRSLQRFQHSFRVSILNQYYRILHLQEATELTEQKLNTLQEAYKQMENLAKVGYAKSHELDRALQDQLRAQDDQIKTMRNYQDALDEFKLLIGVPVLIDFRLDKKELDFVRKVSLKDTKISLQQGMDTALVRRLDLMNQKDNVADRARDVLRKAYNPDTRMVFTNESGNPWPNDPEISTLQYLLHKCNRQSNTYMTYDQATAYNAFQRDIVQLAQEQRQYKHAAETIKKQVRQAHRQLTRSKHRYEVQQQALELARKRVANTSKLLQNGRASIRDVLRAREDEFDAKMDATEALVSHSIATLDFYRDSGVLKINSQGRWEIMAPEQ